MGRNVVQEVTLWFELCSSLFSEIVVSFVTVFLMLNIVWMKCMGVL